MLPKLDVPIYEVKLISTGKTIRFRPFLVKEQKLLLMAQQSEDNKETVTVVKQILKNCIVDEIDVDNLATFDVEYIFLNLRARSVNDIVDLQYKCNNKIKDDKDEEKDCGNLVKLSINLLEIKPEASKIDSKIQLSKNMGVSMKYPTLKMIEGIEGTEVEKLMLILSKCVEYVYDAENIYYSKDIQPEELKEFIENLTGEQFAKIQQFFDNIPKISKKVNFGCSKCGYQEDIVIEGIQNFFV